ncbi:MAG: hypothetical protein R2991_08565 [Thermoanaerobaculia bacterium]
MAGLVGLRVGVVLAIAGWLVWALRRRGAAPAVAALAVAAGVVAARLRLQVRPGAGDVADRDGDARGVDREAAGRIRSGRCRSSRCGRTCTGGSLLGLALLLCAALGGTRSSGCSDGEGAGGEELVRAWSAPVLGAVAALADPYGVGVYTVLGRIREAIGASGCSARSGTRRCRRGSRCSSCWRRSSPG